MNWVKAGLAAAVAAGLLYWGHSRYEAGRAEVLASWTASQLVAERAVRQLEATWQKRVDDERTERDEKVQAVKDGAVRVAANTGRLHRAAILAERNACQATSSPPGREGAGTVLTDVLNRVGERTGELAAYADELRAALDQCRNSWPR